MSLFAGSRWRGPNCHGMHKAWAPRPGHYWDGLTRSEHVPNPQPLIHRRRLFEAAERGDWSELFQLLDDSQERTLNMVSPESSSMHTLLHLAALGNAPVGVVENLLAKGHLRAHRCANGERPVDIARRLGHERLGSLLQPPRQRSIPDSKLAGLEQQFHQFIRKEVGTPQRTPRLPPLELLLELDEPTMIFPVPYMGGIFEYRMQQVAFPCFYSTQEDWILLARINIHMFQGSEARHVITPLGSVLMAEPIID